MYIRTAWAFCIARFQKKGIAKALKYGTGKGKIPTLFLYIRLYICGQKIKMSYGNQDDICFCAVTILLHAGQLIERILHEQGRTVTWFARQLCCTRPNIYKIFRKENIDLQLLWRISCILHHNFFRDISDSFSAETEK